MERAMKDKKLNLEYPCAWTYKIIGSDRREMEKALGEILPRESCSVSFSRRSAAGKYLCLNVEVVLESETHRRAVYEGLLAHPAIRMVL